MPTNCAVPIALFPRGNNPQIAEWLKSTDGHQPYMLADDAEAIFVAKPGTVFNLSGDHELLVREGEITIVTGSRPITIITAMGRVVASANSALNIDQSRFGPVRVANIYGSESQLVCEGQGRTANTKLAANTAYDFSAAKVAGVGAADYANAAIQAPGPLPGMAMSQKSLGSAGAEAAEYHTRLSRLQVCGVPQRVRNNIEKFLKKEGLDASKLADRPNSFDNPAESVANGATANPANIAFGAPASAVTPAQNNTVPPSGIASGLTPLPTNPLPEREKQLAGAGSTQMKLEGLFQELRHNKPLPSRKNGTLLADSGNQLSGLCQMAVELNTNPDSQWFIRSNNRQVFSLPSIDGAILLTEPDATLTGEGQKLTLKQGALTAITGRNKVVINTPLGTVTIPAESAVLVAAPLSRTLQTIALSGKDAEIRLNNNKDSDSKIAVAAGEICKVAPSGVATSGASDFASATGTSDSGVPGLGLTKGSLAAKAPALNEIRANLAFLSSHTLSSSAKQRVAALVSQVGTPDTNPTLTLQPKNSYVALGAVSQSTTADSINRLVLRPSSIVTRQLTLLASKPGVAGNSNATALRLNPASASTTQQMPQSDDNGTILLGDESTGRTIVCADSKRPFVIGSAANAIVVASQGAAFSIETRSKLTMSSGEIIVTTGDTPFTVVTGPAVVTCKPNSATVIAVSDADVKVGNILGSSSISCSGTTRNIAERKGCTISYFKQAGTPGDTSERTVIKGISEAQLTGTDLVSRSMQIAACGYYRLQGDVSDRIAKVIGRVNGNYAIPFTAQENDELGFAPLNAAHYIEPQLSGQHTVLFMPNGAGANSTKKQKQETRILSDMTNLRAVVSGADKPSSPRYLGGSSIASYAIDENNSGVVLAEPPLMMWVVAQDESHPYILEADRECVITADKGTIFALSAEHEVTLKNGTLKVMAGHFPVSVKTGIGSVSVQPHNFAFVRQTTFGNVSVFSTKPSAMEMIFAGVTRNSSRKEFSATRVSHAAVGYSELRVATVTTPVAITTGGTGIVGKDLVDDNRRAQAVASGKLPVEATQLANTESAIFNQFPSTGRTDSVQTFAAAGVVMRYLANTRIDADKLGNLTLANGEVLVDTSRDVSLKAGSWIVSMQRGSLALIKWQDGMLTVRDIVDNGANSVVVMRGTSTMALNPGVEAVCGTRAGDFIHKDGLARRNVKTEQYAGNMEIAHGEISLVSLAANHRLVSSVLATPGAEERAIRERVIKMAAVLTQVTASHGAYKPAASKLATK